MKTFINKYQNLWYALAIFFYIDLITLTSVFVGKEVSHLERASGIKRRWVSLNK